MSIGIDRSSESGSLNSKLKQHRRWFPQFDGKVQIPYFQAERELRPGLRLEPESESESKLGLQLF